MGFNGPDFPSTMEILVMGAVIGFLLAAIIAVAVWFVI